MISHPAAGVENRQIMSGDCFIIMHLFISSIPFTTSEESVLETCVFPFPAFGVVDCSFHPLCVLNFPVALGLQ